MSNQKEIIETIMSIPQNWDSKHKHNASSKNIPLSIANTINEGELSIEELEKLIGADFPIYRYKTQITIHGIFPDMRGRVHGYKWLTRNKNLSLGVKWGAIDEAKREEMSQPLKIALGLRYHRDSNNQSFEILKRTTKETYEQDKKPIMELAQKIHYAKNLYYGGVDVCLLSYMGMHYINLVWTVKSIYKTNIPILYEALDVDLKKVEDAVKEKELSTLKRLEKQRDEARRRMEVNEKKLKEAEEYWGDLLKYPKVRKTKDTGLYITPKIDYTDSVVYQVSLLYRQGRQKKSRLAHNTFPTVEEALAYTPEPSYLDSIFNGSITGFKIE